MTKYLVIVESPAKAKTIKKYLGKDYQVLASYGHVRDLLPKEGAVDTENDFAMRYQEIERNAKHMDAIAKAMSKVDELLLAPDPDREGEAIAWHVYEILRERGIIDGKPVRRIVFHEITTKAVKAATEAPREIAMDLVYAQQARRALDYLVGFNLSPLLWKKIRRGLSAGRVQSPALRLIVERELDIEKFEPKEYWSILANVQKDKATPFQGKLIEYKGKKVEQFTINKEKQAKDTKKVLEKAANGELLVTKVEKKQRKRNPAPPFITSTLQQEAARKLGFTAQRTMRVAQQLYEGIDIGQGTVGLITYMRTDSVTLAQEALDDIRKFIAKRYGKDNVPKDIRRYKTKSKNAQEAHEAIRPTTVQQTPDIIKEHLSAEQFKLYRLIWQRTVACQMIHATLNTVSINLQCGDDGVFRATGSVIANPGFISVYQEGRDDDKGEDDEKHLPELNEGDKVKLLDIEANQHFTEPPPRFSEASLVKALEEYGIGRPSTYASIIATLQNREYVLLEQKRFYPTDVGRVVNKFLTQYFTQYVDYDFTAKLEDHLDAVARGEEGWVPLLETFWGPFKKLVGEIDTSVERKDVTQEAMDEACPKCEKPLSTRLGRRGKFIGCTGYPDCDYTRNVDGDAEESTEPEIIPDRKCPECESELQIRHGRYGKFIGCTGYPKCKFIEPLEKPKDTEIACPVCKAGTLLERRSRRGKIFYSCSTYPKCDYAIWNEPVNEPCPTCEWPLLSIKTTKRRGTEKVCPQKECDFSEQIEAKE